jgi:hypothetical protein
VDVRLGATPVAAVHLGGEKVWPVAAATPPVAGYAAWWDFSDTASLQLSGNSIQRATDKSGNNNHLTASSMPTHTTSTLLGGGAMRVAAFDGNANVMATAADPLTGDFTTLAVAAKPDDLNTDVLFRQRGLAYYLSGLPDIQMWQGDASSHVSADRNDWLSAKVHTRKLSGATHSAWINTTNKVNAVLGTAGTTEPFYVGGEATAGFGNWVVGEVVVYPTALSDADRQAVTQYLRTKWGIA